MKAKEIFKRFIPVVLAGTAMIVLAMPIKAMAHDHDDEGWHHDNGRHLGWYKHGWNHDGDEDDDHCDFRRPRRYYQPRPYYPDNYDYAPPAYPPIVAYPPAVAYPPVGYGAGLGTNNLEQQWMNARARHQQAIASGNRRLARKTSERLYQLDRKMGVANTRLNNGYYNNGYYGNGYDNGYYNNNPYQNGSVIGPILGNLLGNY